MGKWTYWSLLPDQNRALLDCRKKNQSVVNATVHSTALPNNMGMDIKQGNDHRPSTICGGKSLLIMVIKTTKKEEYLLPSK